MTASLPLPDEQPSDLDPDAGVESAAASAGRPARAPRTPAKKTSSAARAPRSTKSTSRTATAKKSGATSTAKKSGAASTTPEAAAPVDPGPPPPVPDDIVIPAGIVIPPKPPLPPVVLVPPAPVSLAEPEPESEPQPAAEPTPIIPEADVEPEPDVEPQPEAELVEPEREPEPESAVVVESEPELVEPELVEPEPELVEPEPTPLVLVDEQARAAADDDTPALVLTGVTKTFGETRAVDGVDLTVPAGSFYGLVGPNGAGKTTTLSMIAGLLRPDSGAIEVAGIDAGADRAEAQRRMGVLPDRLRTFDRLTGRQLLYYYGVLRGLPAAVAESRTVDLARAFDLVEALGRPVSDYSAGMTKKVMLAGAMIHSPRVLVLDEPFESVDPVSSAVILDILSAYVDHGGTVILSSHGMQLVERVCTRVAVLVSGTVLAEGTVDDVRGTATLEERFLELVGRRGDLEGLEWLHTFSD